MEENYQACLQYIFQKLPMFTRVGAVAYKPNLDNIIALCNSIGNPQHSFKSVHIAGTNGKGSCSHFLAAIFQENGYKTGLYTSPHIIDFRERIRINGIEIPQKNVIDFIEKTRQTIEKLQPSFFEIAVAMAFDFFANEQVDIAIIEVGLGGLLDSTNIIIPEISVITNISLDHTNLLGSTIEEIASQKAGIIKQHIPVVIGESQIETEKIFFTKSIMRQSQIIMADKQFQIVHHEMVEGKLVVKVVNNATMSIEYYLLDLVGNYQLKNIKTVLTTIEILQKNGWHFSLEKIKKALANTQKITGIKGRFEIVHKHPTIIFDVSHNEAGLKELMSQLISLTYKKLYVILGFVSDKDVQKVLKLFPQTAYYFFSQSPIQRALPFWELEKLAVENNLIGESASSITLSLNKSILLATKNDLILVTGSFFNLEEAYQFIDQINIKK